MFSPKILTSLLAIVACSAACYGGGQGADALSEQDVAAIAQITEEQFTQYMIADDWENLGNLMKDDVVLMSFGVPEVQGKEVILEALERNWGLLPLTKFEQRNTKIDGRGDLAYARGTYSLAVEIEGSPRISDEGKFLVIFEKQADGAWLMSTVNYSRNTAKPTVEEM
ncbi:MAG: hypothetical protein AMS21_08045 [Gemmatimonas sp. SG8_38_2]|nr:MAG: hypothetical protein AMS21_08045 [Gemmatimonas sp. SG8_38_2]